MPATDPTISPSLLTALISAITVLSGAVVYLFKFYSGRLAAADEARCKRDETVAAERALFAADRARWEAGALQLRAEYEEKHRKLAEDMSKLVQLLQREARDQENLARREYAENMEVIAAKAAESSDKIGAVMEKMLERVMGTRRPYGGKGTDK